MNHVIENAIYALTVEDLSSFTNIEFLLKEKKKQLKEEKRLQADHLKRQKKEERLIKNLERDRKKAQSEELKATKAKSQARLKLEKAERDEAHSKAVKIAKNSELKMRLRNESLTADMSALTINQPSASTQLVDGYFECDDYSSDYDDYSSDYTSYSEPEFAM